MYNPVEVLAKSVYSALYADLPMVKEAFHKNIQSFRRPEINEVKIKMFLQTWSTTSLGFGGIGGQGFTSAYTVIVTLNETSAVYFNGRLAYYADAFNKEFVKDVVEESLVEVSKSKRYRTTVE